MTAIRKQDQRHLVTVGLVLWSLDRPGLTSGFVPKEIAPELDFIAVHLYPEKDKIKEELETLSGFAVGKPMIIEEMFPMSCPLPEFERFLDESRKTASGWIGFYWGKTPEECRRSSHPGRPHTGLAGGLSEAGWRDPATIPLVGRPMQMANLLIAYDTTEGQTRKVAQHVADAIARSGWEVQVIDIRRPPTGFTLDGYDAIVIGASIHLGKHSRQLSEFVGRHIARLNAVPSGFFSVSLSAAGSEKERADAGRFVEEFLTQSGWNPVIKATVAGGLRYREYNFLKRWLMRKIARSAGKDTDTSRNHEYTDWKVVDQFVVRFLSSRKGREQHGPPETFPAQYSSVIAVRRERLDRPTYSRRLQCVDRGLGGTTFAVWLDDGLRDEWQVRAVSRLRVDEEDGRNRQAVTELEGGGIEPLAEEGGPEVELIAGTEAVEALEDVPVHMDGEAGILPRIAG